MSAELELVRLVRRIALEEARAAAGAWCDGTVEGVDGLYASVRKVDPAASPTPGFYVPPDLHVLAGDHVWCYDASGFKFVDHVFNRNAVVPAGLTLDSPLLAGTWQRVGGVLTPPSLSADVDNYAPDGGTLAYRWRQDLAASHYTSGFLAEGDGTEHEWCNINATATWTLKHLTGSASANQIICPGYADYALGPGASVRGWYDGLSAKWRLVGK